MTQTFALASDFRTGTDTDLVALQSSILTQQLTTPRQPAWVSRYPLSEVSFPEVFIYVEDILGSSGATTPTFGTNHTHTSGTYESEQFSANINQNVARAALFQISNPLIVDTIATLSFKSPNAALDNVYYDVFQVKSDGSAVLVRSSADISGLISGVGTNIIEASITPLPVQPGERYIVRMRNNSSTTTLVAPVFVWQSLFGPEYYLGMYTSTLSTNTSYTAAEIQAMKDATAFCPWFAMASTGSYETERSFYDDFNRSDNSDPGALWALDAALAFHYLILSGGRVVIHPTVSAGTNVTGARLFLRATQGDDQRVGANFYNLTSTTAEAGIVLGASTDFANWVRLAVTATGAKIYSRIGGTITQRATQSTTGDNNVQWYLTYSSATKTYTAYRDEEVITSWVDSGNLMPHGELYRYGGLAITRVFTGGIDVQGGGVDNWTLRDWM